MFRIMIFKAIVLEVSSGLMRWLLWERILTLAREQEVFRISIMTHLIIDNRAKVKI